MKKIMFLLIAAVLLTGFFSCGTAGAGRSDDSPDWAGVYSGLIPAADGPGIMVRITLKKDQAYEVSYQYIDKGDEVFVRTGFFKWANKGKTIILDTDDIPRYYNIGDNIMTQLDIQGETIDGEHAGDYVLNIQP